jgi:hypothetical protein
MMSKLIDLPSELARKLAAMGHTATAEERDFMSEMALRQREPNALESDLEAFPNRRGLSETALKKEALDFFKKLESFGCGKVLLGRRKLKTRIRWHPYGAIAVAKAFLKDLDSCLETDSGPREEDVSSIQPSATIQCNLHQHRFLLRPDFEIAVGLPLDLTKDEANRLAEFIRSIPF